MAFNSTAPLAQLVTLLEGLSGMQRVYVGVPEAPDSQVFAYVALAAQRVSDKASSGLLKREFDYFVGMGYVVEGSEATAETTLAALVDAFLVALYEARRTNLGGTVQSVVGVDLALASDPRYQVVVGLEFRVFPILVTVAQSANY